MDSTRQRTGACSHAGARRVPGRPGNPGRAGAHRCQRGVADRRLAVQRRAARLCLQRDAFGRVGRRRHDLPPAALRAAWTVRRCRRGSSASSHGAAGRRPAASGAHARHGGAGRCEQPRGPGDRTGRAGLRGGERRAPGGVSPAPATRGRSADWPRQRAAAYRPGPGRRDRPGDRRGPARRRVRAGGLPRQRGHFRGVRAARLHVAPVQGHGRREPRRGDRRAGRAADGPRHAVRASALRPRRHGRAHLWRPDRSVGHLRGPVARPGHRRVRPPARGLGRRRADQRGVQRSAGHEPATDAHRGGRGGTRVRQPARLRGQRRTGRRADRHGGRRRRARLLRGGQRDGARARDPERDARPGRGAVRRQFDRGDGGRRGPRLHPRQRRLARPELLDPGRRGRPSWR